MCCIPAAIGGCVAGCIAGGLCACMFGKAIITLNTDKGEDMLERPRAYQSGIKVKVQAGLRIPVPQCLQSKLSGLRGFGVVHLPDCCRYPCPCFFDENDRKRDRKKQRHAKKEWEEEESKAKMAQEGSDEPERSDSGSEKRRSSSEKAHNSDKAKGSSNDGGHLKVSDEWHVVDEADGASTSGDAHGGKS